jgi:hypothetical protein
MTGNGSTDEGQDAQQDTAGGSQSAHRSRVAGAKANEEKKWLDGELEYPTGEFKMDTPQDRYINERVAVAVEDVLSQLNDDHRAACLRYAHHRVRAIWFGKIKAAMKPSGGHRWGAVA